MASGSRSLEEMLRLVELAVRNPYEPSVADARREAMLQRRWPADGKSWQLLWSSLPAPLQTDEPAVIACLLGAGDDVGVTRTAAFLSGRAQPLQPAIVEPCAEISSRALRVNAALASIVGNTRVMHDVRRMCWAAAFGERLDTAIAMARLFQTTPVLVTGATGTGKELVAQTLCQSMRGSWSHGKGWRAAPTESVHLASLPASLVESALFGHVKGSYSGALTDRKGVFERCHGGVVFLDEIAELPMSTQVTLLRTLQEGKARRLGADSDHDAAPRIVSATHKDLEELVAEGSFRLDLLHRLSSVVIQLPPLVERLADLPLLVEREVQNMVEPSVRPTVRDRVEQFVLQHASYTWPGNVRELHGVVRTLALGLEPRLRQGRASSGTNLVVPRRIADGRSTLRQAQAWYCRHVAERTKPMAQAAKVLGIDRGTLRGHLAEDGDAS